MLYHLLITPLILGLLFAGWIALQAWFRRRSPTMGPDADVLQGRFSCGTCIGFEECHVVFTDPPPPPSTPDPGLPARRDLRRVRRNETVTDRVAKHSVETDGR